MTEVRITHVGGPTVLIEVGGWRLLTDPTFDPPGRNYPFGWGTSSRKLAGPAIAAVRPRRRSTRCCSPTTTTPTTSTPPDGRCSRRAGSSSPRFPARSGWAVVRADSRHGTRRQLEADGRTPIDITATPCRHGPPLSHPLVGDVIGFALRWDGQEHGVLWISGDTVLYDGVRQVADRLQVDTALLHLGGVRFPITGPVRYTMTARDAVELCRLIRPRTAIPIHYEGWKHFRQGRQAIEREFARAPEDVRRRIQWLPIGVEVEIAA